MFGKRATIASLLVLMTMSLSGATMGSSVDPPVVDEQQSVIIDGQVVPGGMAPTSHDNLADLDGETFLVEACQYVDPNGTGVRPSLHTGFTNYGTIGDPNTGVGFRVPATPTAESLAVGWWGEGWVVDFGFGPRSYYRSGPIQGPIERVDDSYTDSSRYTKYLATVFLPLDDVKGDEGSDQGVLVDFEFTIDRHTCDVVLRTTIENQADFDLTIGYDRSIDWDVWMMDQGTFVNCWHNIPDGVRAFIPFQGMASGSCKDPLGTASQPRAECQTTVLGQGPALIPDLFAWDDLANWGPGGFHHVTTTPHAHDDNGGIHFERHLDPHDRWTTFLKYECTGYVGLVDAELPRLPLE